MSAWLQHNALARMKGEDGATIVIAAIAIPVLVVFCAFVVDIGNWFVHKRHLQMQADAAALAAAGNYVFTCNDTAVKDTAKKYSGTDAAGYNSQLGGTPASKVHLLVNSKTYFNQPSPSDSSVSDPNTCTSRMIDVKLTETDLPLFFHLASMISKVPFINAHARVEFMQTARTHVPPLAVPDSDPQSVKVTFLNQTSGAELASATLRRNGTDSNGLAIWDNASALMSLPAVVPNMSIRVALSGSGSTTCGDPLVECYNLTNTTNGGAGLLSSFIRAYTTAGSGAQPNPPLVRSVELFPGNCPDGYFIYLSSGNCTVGVRAYVDFGPCQSNVLPSVQLGSKLTATLGNSSYPMTNVACPVGTSNSQWVTSGAPIPIAAQSGWSGITLQWEETRGVEGQDTCKLGGGNKCKGTFDPDNPVHQLLSTTNDLSGPIRSLQISENGTVGANSFAICGANCRHNLGIRLSLLAPVQKDAINVNEPPITLRTVNNTRAIDCDPNKSLRDELATGCGPEYKVNPGDPCPSKAVLLSSPQPWECVATDTGGAVGQVYQGMDARIDCKSNPNHWYQFPNLSPTDPRLVPVMLTPYGALSTASNGSGTIPVKRFATFYVTGYIGNQNQRSASVCPGDTDDSDPKAQGEILGHFVKYIQTFNNGTAGTTKCDFNTLGSCVAVLTQ